MLSIFISYSRRDEDKTRVISEDLKSLDYEVWFDTELHGGEHWWEKILENIRRIDIFIFILSSNSLKSKPCTLEYKYASSLGKPILPILVSKDVSINLLPSELAKINIIKYFKEDKKFIFNIVKSIKNIPLSTSLPSPLPIPPSIPIARSSQLMEKINSSEILTPQEQNNILFEIKHNFKEKCNEEDFIKLLDGFEKRGDLYVSTSEEIKHLKNTLKINIKPIKTKIILKKLVLTSISFITTIALGLGSGVLTSKFLNNSDLAGFSAAILVWLAGLIFTYKVWKKYR